MIKSRQKIVTLACGLLAFSAASYGDTPQTHDSIRQIALQHALTKVEPTGGKAEVTVGRLDSRLKLSACDLPLEGFDSPNGLQRGRGVVGVRCNGGKPWKIYVPVRIATLESVVVSRRPIVRGQTIQAADVNLKQMDVARFHRAYYTRIGDIVGLTSKRAIKPGATLFANMLQRRKLVKRGAQVEILVSAGGLHVRMAGKALSDGGRGDRIKVRNLNSGKVITGTIAGPGVIHVAQ